MDLLFFDCRNRATLFSFISARCGALDDVVCGELPTAAELVRPDAIVIVVREKRAGVYHEHVVLAKVGAQHGGDSAVGGFPLEGNLQSANFLSCVMCWLIWLLVLWF